MFKRPILIGSDNECEGNDLIALITAIDTACFELAEFGSTNGLSRFQIDAIKRLHSFACNVAERSGLITEWAAKEAKEYSLPTRNRGVISEELRAEIIKRAGGCCVACGDTENLTIDHIKPVSHGGDHGRDNLTVLCHRCNSSRGLKSYAAWLEASQ